MVYTHLGASLLEEVRAQVCIPVKKTNRLL